MLKSNFFTLFFSITLFCCSGLLAQDTTTAQHSIFSYRNYERASVLNNDFVSNGFKNALSADFGFFMNSNFINNTFSNYYILQTNFDDKLKNSILGQLKENSTYELDAGGSLMYLHKAERFPLFGKGIYHIAFTNANYTILRAPADAIRFALNGNAQFENDTAILGPLTSQKFAYNQLRFGVRKDYEKNTNKFRLGVSLSFIQGFQNWVADISRGSLFTALDGEYIDLDYNMKLQLGYSGAPNGFEFNGLGFSGDVLFSWQRDDKSFLEIDLKDLGIVNWQREATTVQADSFIHYQGIEVTDFFELQDSFLTASYIDSLVEEILPSESKSAFSTSLPFTVDLTYSHALASGKAAFTLGLRYRNVSGYGLFSFVKANYFFTSKVSAGASLAYGGYGTYRTGLEFAKNWNRYWAVLGTSAVEGFIIPGKATSGSLYINLGARF